MLMNKTFVVKDILQKHPLTRDDDNLLYSKVAERILAREGRSLAGISAQQFLDMVSLKKLPQFETIRRTRQKLQENEPLLRGHRYDQRHGYEREVRKEIKEFTSTPEPGQQKFKLFD